MVVASGGWIQNANFSPSQNNSNLNLNAQDNKMAAKGILICRDNSHPFQERTLTLDQPVKIGRSVARARATPNNAIFDCKVLSRNHALLWYSIGKFYLQDTKSSNGTFVNNQRLSLSGQESEAREVCSGDIVQFGVDVVETTKKVTHGCIVATLKLYLPDGKEAKASLSMSVACPVGNILLEDLYKLNHFLQEANRREKDLNTKLVYLQTLVESTRHAANLSWKALIDEDRLLSRVETAESQLAVYSKNFTEDKMRNELVKFQEEKAQYQATAKEALQNILQEKLEVTQRLTHLERQLNETEEECQSLHEVAKHTQTELQELAIKYTDAQKKLNETSNQLIESEEKMKEIVQRAEREKEDLLKRIDDQTRSERSLQQRLKDSRLDSVNVHKQITALRNYMQTLQDMKSKLCSDEHSESKDEMNPIEAINAILNKLNSVSMDNFDNDGESNFYPNKTEQDNQLNSQDMDSNQIKSVDLSYVKNNHSDSFADNDSVTEYILPPPSRKTLVNGTANSTILETSMESDGNSETTDDTYSIESDDISEKSVIEIKDSEENSTPTKTATVPTKLEVRFASGENGEQLEVRYEPVEQTAEEVEIPDSPDDNYDRQLTDEDSNRATMTSFEVRMDDQADKDGEPEECDGEHLEGDYVKTLKPLSKDDLVKQSLHSREYVLQTLIGSLDSLKGEDDLEARQLVKKELEELREWLIREPNEIVVNKLKELYYRTKNETQRMQEVNEELVILKEKYNACAEEKTELVKKYEALKAQCGDLLNATYSIPVHYVAPIVIALMWMLFEKIF